ncbi:putative phosphoesterase [Pullulanibacillus camelliae]|uniref:Putative phosphoesterase GCM10011391_32770 n=1 Tax=Pullulanibacillus camelliae TaxID=1707096 RepID=A0A8J2YLI8_9BACL|nr:YjcG family protein [Pullulanibacillus camelliae]GGE51441.1 putative phosphoesterase [Pullulanibacillus camelliae]
MKYGIAMFPSKRLQDEVNSYRKRYDPHYAYIPPHITLKEPFELEEAQIDATIEKIQSIASQVEPVKIVIDKVSSFHPVNNVIYLKVQENPNLTKLHDLLHGKDFKNRDHTYNFVPHITIAQGLADLEHSDILDLMKMIDFHYEETIDRFQLLYQLDNQVWAVHETFHLNKG